MTKEQLIELVRFTAGEIVAPTELSVEDAESIVDDFVNKEQLTIPVVACSACGAENSIRWDKHCIGIDDKQESYKDLSFQFCEECGDVTNVDFS